MVMNTPSVHPDPVYDVSSYVFAVHPISCSPLSANQPLSARYYYYAEQVATIVVDVTDQDAMARTILQQDDVRPLDLVVANAGISATTLANSGAGGGSKVRQLEIFCLTLTSTCGADSQPYS